MDIRYLLFLYEVRKLPKAFEQERDNMIKEADAICNYLQSKVETPPIHMLNNYTDIISFPKNIVRLTKMMCSCNDYCVSYSMYYTEFNKECKLYDLEDLYTDDRYHSSNLINKKVIYNRLEPKDYVTDEFVLKNEIYDLILDLCNDKPFSLQHLKCKAYELRDYCGNDKRCYIDMLNFRLQTPDYDRKLSTGLCKNKNYRLNLNKIQDDIYIPLLYKKEKAKRGAIYSEYEVSGKNFDFPINEIILVAVLVSISGILIYLTNKKKYKVIIAFILMIILGILKIFI